MTTNVLAALTVVVVFFIGKELFNRWAGIAAAAFLMFDPVHMFYSTRILTDVPGTFFVTLTLYFWVRTEQRDEDWSFYATFAAGALTILTKMNGIVVLPALFVYYLWKEGKELFLQRRYWYAFFTTAGIYSIWEIRTFLTLGFSPLMENFLTNYLAFAEPGGIGSGGGGGGKLFADIGVVEGATSHITSLPVTLGVPALILFVTGLVIAYIYRDDRLTIPAIYMVVTFLVLSSKGLNRYFLPFIPMALVVAGYGADRVRGMVANWNERAGRAAIGILLIVSVFFMFQSSAALISASAPGFVGLDEAGRWVDENAAEDAKLVAGSVHQMRFFSKRWVTGAGRFKSAEDIDPYMAENGIDYVEVDRWEETQPQAFVQHVQQSDAYVPVHAVRQNGNPVVVIYRVNDAELGS